MSVYIRVTPDIQLEYVWQSTYISVSHQAWWLKQSDCELTYRRPYWLFPSDTCPPNRSQARPGSSWTEVRQVGRRLGSCRLRLLKWTIIIIIHLLDSLFYIQKTMHLTVTGRSNDTSFIIKRRIGVEDKKWIIRITYILGRLKQGEIITLHKSGRRPNSYRAIALTFVILKIYENILIDICKHACRYDLIARRLLEESWMCNDIFLRSREHILHEGRNSIVYACFCRWQVVIWPWVALWHL